MKRFCIDFRDERFWICWCEGSELRCKRIEADPLDGRVLELAGRMPPCTEDFCSGVDI